MTDSIRIGTRDFPLGKHTYVMGILNLTPDSFSDGGRYQAMEAALCRAEEMERQGADIIDVGGESTRPGHARISEREEIRRVVPVIRAIKEHCGIPVSVDTYKSQVAGEALRAGADMVNDIWGLKYDGKMAGVIKEYEAAVCLMHNREEKKYASLVREVMAELMQSAALAGAAGIGPDKMILDPGIGFGKDYRENLLLLKQMGEFAALDMPLLLGASRKSVIGKALDLPKDQREEGTLALTALAVTAGWHFVRVHDVEKNVRLIKMMEAVKNA